MISKRKYNKHNNACSCIVSSRVPRHLANKVKELANETNRTVSDVICIILDSYFTEECPFESEE